MTGDPETDTAALRAFGQADTFSIFTPCSSSLDAYQVRHSSTSAQRACEFDGWYPRRRGYPSCKGNALESADSGEMDV